MNTEFLSAVLPTEGKYCVFAMTGTLRKNIFVDTLENVIETAAQLSASGANAFFALSTFDDEGVRKAVHAQYVRALFFDLDCGWDKEKGKWKAFRNKREAVEKLSQFLADTGLDQLGEPWLNDSGGGVHGYFPFHSHIPVAEWQPIAEMLKSAAKKFGFPIDQTVTGDAARVLRVPETFNYKYEEPKPVVRKSTGSTFDPADLKRVLEPHAQGALTARFSAPLMIPGERLHAAPSVVMKAMMGNSVSRFKKILQRTAEGTGCRQLAHYIQNAADDGMEPVWRSMLSIAKFCEDGEKASKFLSGLHPYDDNRRVIKLHEIKGPYHCVTIEQQSGIMCGDCPHAGKITSPIALGRETAVVEARETEVKDEVSGEKVKAKMPDAPRNFSYGRNSGLYYTKPKGKDDDEANEPIMILNHDLYMSRLFNDNGNFLAEFIAVKEHSTTTFALPTEVLSRAGETIKVLARNSVLSVGGEGTDIILAKYVRECVQAHSSIGQHVTVPPNMGWQANGDFVIGNRVISAMGRKYDYTFKSDRLSNVMDATASKGSLGEWKKVPRMLRDKAMRDPNVIGHCAISLTNFASTLMFLAPRGAQAGVMHLAAKESGGGKTMMSHVSNSIFGEPAGLMVGSGTSSTTMLQRAGLLGSISLNVDEITAKNRNADKEWIPTFLYDYSHGAHKVKGSATGNAEIQQNCTWAAIALLSSNDPQAESMMSARKHSSLGEMQRFLEWKLPRNWTLSFTNEEHAILSLMNTNYGVAGPAWIEWLQENMDLAKQRWEEMRKFWREVSNASDSERFWTNKITCYLTAAVLTNKKHADLTDYDFNALVNFFLKIIQYMRSVINTNKLTATDMLDAYVREYTSHLVKVSANGIPQFLGTPGIAPKSTVRGRYEDEVTPGHVDFFIEVRLLKAYCANLGHSYMDFITELRDSMPVVDCRRDLLAGTNNPPLRVACIRITRSKADMQKLDQLDALGLQ